MGRATNDIDVLKACGSSVDLEEVIELHAPVWMGGSKCVVRVKSDDAHDLQGWRGSERNGP